MVAFPSLALRVGVFSHPAPGLSTRTAAVKISIIIPLFDKSAYIERALASIAAQTFDDYEVIVVDDGSRDDGPAKVRDWNDARVRLIQQPNAGPGAARNRGIAEARADWLAFLDADDEW